VDEQVIALDVKQFEGCEKGAMSCRKSLPESFLGIEETGALIRQSAVEAHAVAQKRCKAAIGKPHRTDGDILQEVEEGALVIAHEGHDLEAWYR